MYDIA